MMRHNKKPIYEVDFGEERHIMAKAGGGGGFWAEIG